MTLSTSLSNAFSGLTAASRSVEVVSSNIANAMTPGFARREVDLSSRFSGGVSVNGVNRLTDQRAVADQRDARAGQSSAEFQADAWLRIESSIGYPTESGSLTGRISAFEADLISAASRPDEAIRLDKAVVSAGSLAESIRSAASEIQSMRRDADSDIASMVEGLNRNLERVETLNAQVLRQGDSGIGLATLLDQRQGVIDEIAEVLPVQQVMRENGRVALYAQSGLGLIDGRASQFEFDPTATITAYQSIEAGLLSGLTFNGEQVDTSRTANMLGAGRLSAAFDARDRVGPEAQQRLDSFARDLVERFQDPGLDPSLAAGQAGLFSDSGAAFDPADEIGLASRITLNAAVDPDQGGAPWRLRDGIAAVSPGSVGASSLLTAQSERISVSRISVSGPTTGQSLSLTDHAAEILSWAAVGHDRADDQMAFHAARSEALMADNSDTGVDTDDEMQKLLLVEQAYAANARVLQTLDDLMQQLLRI